MGNKRYLTKDNLTANNYEKIFNTIPQGYGRDHTGLFDG